MLVDDLQECMAMLVEEQVCLIAQWWARWDGVYSDSLHLCRRPFRAGMEGIFSEELYDDALDTMAHLARLAAGEFVCASCAHGPIFIPLERLRFPEAWIAAERALWAALVAECGEEMSQEIAVRYGYEPNDDERGGWH